MGNRRNVIMLNGKRYDASTGEQLADEPHDQRVSSATKQPVGKSPLTTPNKTVDGFTKRRSVASFKSERKPEKSKTLMRGAVKKPDSAVGAKQPKTVAKSKTITTPTTHVDPVRELRATQTKRSKLISKFGKGTSKVKFATVAVAEAPDQKAPLASHSQPKNPNHSPEAKKSNRFENAIEAANSHKQSKTKKNNKRTKLARKLRISPRLLNVSMMLFAGVLIGGYVALNNVPNLAMRIASTRSGVNAGLPEYQPSGFAIKGPIKYQPGKISVNFGSNSDQRNYVVNQTKSEWNSDSLLENHVATNNRAYQTFQEKGKTIYLYDGDNASWVDNGIWYEIDGNSSLSSDQIIRIANSL